MDAIALLTADHNRVRGLFTRFKEAEGDGRQDEVSALATKIVEELEVHSTIEEEIFYPAVRARSEEVAELVAEGIEEHNVVKRLISELGPSAGSEEWVAKLKVLIENVEHHAEEEEQEMFPKVRSAFDAATLTALAEEMTERKAALGAPTINDTIDLTAEELAELARAQQIPGRSSMNKEELAATVDPRG